LQFLLELKNTILAELGYILLLFLPPAAVILTFYRRQKKEKAEAEAPFDELRCRPAGEGARLQMERLTEEIDPWLGCLILVPIILALWLTLQRPNLTLAIIGFLFCAIFSALAQRRLGPLVKRRAAYRLGFQGERFVAEELNQLIADGFRVFHDVPFDKYNIDHVVVGPAGVFAIETKARRKKFKHGGERHIVIFTGKRLEFPGGWNVEWLNQARLNAETLSQWIRASSAEQVAVEPILTIPGWWVEPNGTGDVHVFNPKQIRGLIRSLPQNALNGGQIQRIAHQLEEKCRLAVE